VPWAFQKGSLTADRWREHSLFSANFRKYSTANFHFMNYKMKTGGQDASMAGISMCSPATRQGLPETKRWNFAIEIPEPPVKIPVSGGGMGWNLHPAVRVPRWRACEIRIPTNINLDTKD
jgi:hypothetical protein